MNFIKYFIIYLQSKFAAFIKRFSKNKSSDKTSAEKYQHIHDTIEGIDDVNEICEYLKSYTNFPLKVIVELRNGTRSLTAESVTDVAEILNAAKDNGICMSLSLSPGYKRLVISPFYEGNIIYQYVQLS